MARTKKPVHKVQMTEWKRNIIHLLDGTIKKMMVTEMDNHLGYQKSNVQTAMTTVMTINPSAWIIALAV